MILNTNELDPHRPVPVAERKPIRPTHVSPIRVPVKVIKPVAPRVATIPARAGR